jgi:hypothetical protein
MSLVKHNNNSISDITSAGQLAQGKMTLISSQTASGSASISFTSGIDSTYPIYRFEFINCQPQTDAVVFQFNISTDGGSNYNVVKTTTSFQAYHNEADGITGLAYETGRDLAQSTSYQDLTLGDNGSGSDENIGGFLEIYNPSSDTFVKHFLCVTNTYYANNFTGNTYVAGYGNTSTPINSLIFRMSSGNINGTIKLYGIGE